MSELEKINEFRKEFCGKHHKPIAQGDWDRIKKQIYVIRYVEEELIGLATMFIVESLTKKALIIEDIIIDRRYRKMGYGSKILQMIIDFAKKKKVDCIEVCTKKDNKIAQGLYLKFGFKDRKNIALRLWLKQG